MNMKTARLLLLMIFAFSIMTLTVRYLLYPLDNEIYLNFPASILSDKVHADTSTADDLAGRVRILCFITSMRGKEERAVAVNVTWLKRCTRHVFVSSSRLQMFRDDEVLVLSDVPEGRDHLTAKTFAALLHFYQHELNNYDWFLKADDDTYVVVENLRLLLSHHSPDDAVYLGQHLQTRRWTEGNGYMSGGASYVLSRQALRVMVEKGFPHNGGVCHPREPDEDVEVGRCLHALGIEPHRTVDSYGRETFHLEDLPQTFFIASFSTYPIHTPRAGPECCSQLSISFHHLSPRTIYTMELLLYHINVYGRHPDDLALRRSLFQPQEERLVTPASTHHEERDRQMDEERDRQMDEERDRQMDAERERERGGRGQRERERD